MPNDAALLEQPGTALISVDEFQRMIDTGEIAEDAPVELLAGRIVEKMTKHPPHILTVKRLTRLFFKILPDGWHPQFQDSIRLQDSMPEPDGAIIRGTAEEYDRLAEVDDIGLVIEVSDTTVNNDRSKAVLYARNGVSRYWLINLPDDCIEVYDELTEADSEAFYKHVETYQRNESLTLILDGQSIAEVVLSDLLPPEE